MMDIEKYRRGSEITPGAFIYTMPPTECRGEDEKTLSELCMVRITYLQMYRVLCRIEKILLGTEKWVELKLNELFEDDGGKRKAHGGKISTPGSVKIFSSDHLCWYDGKNWNRIDPKTWF